MCSLRDAADDFRRLNVTVYGISLDDVRSQASFKKQLGLGFALLSDPNGSVASSYQVLIQRPPMARRVTFLIDDKGIIRHIEEKVDLRNHGAELVGVITKLRS